ncbi:MAG: DUF1361 domain-containing protein [Candidatus Roizmanbacteria bacterium]
MTRFQKRLALDFVLVSQALFLTSLIISRNALFISPQRNDGGITSYNFLLFNTLLAWIPYLIGRVLCEYRKYLQKYVQIFFILLWLLFFPNAFYVMTDVMHYLELHNAPSWFDALLLMIHGAHGILVGSIAAVYLVKLYTVKIRERIYSYLGVAVLNSIGIYTGRFLRFNSWDTLSNPFSIVATIIERYTDVISHPVAYPFTLIVALFSLSMFCIVDLLSMQGNDHK